LIEASNKRNLALEKYFFDLEIIKPKAKNSDDETMLHILNDVNIRVIAKKSKMLFQNVWLSEFVES